MLFFLLYIIIVNVTIIVIIWNQLQYPLLVVDPPQALGLEELMVQNLKRSELTISVNGTFSFNISWDAPSYLKRTGCENLLHFYTYQWGDPNEMRPCLWPWWCLNERWGQIKFTVSHFNIVKKLTSVGFQIPFCQFWIRFHALDSIFQMLNSGFHLIGFRIPKNLDTNRW